jgi:hypothetical protein
MQCFSTAWAMLFSIAAVFRRRPDVVSPPPSCLPVPCPAALPNRVHVGAHSHSMCGAALDPQVLCNGPGTCIPICFAAFLLRVSPRPPPFASRCSFPSTASPSQGHLAPRGHPLHRTMDSVCSIETAELEGGERREATTLLARPNSDEGIALGRYWGWLPGE